MCNVRLTVTETSIASHDLGAEHAETWSWYVMVMFRRFCTMQFSHMEVVFENLRGFVCKAWTQIMNGKDFDTVNALAAGSPRQVMKYIRSRSLKEEFSLHMLHAPMRAIE